MESIIRPRVFLDINIGTEPIGRLVIELFIDKAPKTCENFRSLCTTSAPPLTYKLSPFHRILPNFMVQGGDITKGNGTGGVSIYGRTFEDENLGWRDIDASGLVCMANRGRDTNSSQFFISLVPCQHLNGKHTVFGHVVAGHHVLDRMAKVTTNGDDRPTVDVVIAHCGEIKQHKSTKLQPSSLQPSEERGRRNQRCSRSKSLSRSQSPSRGHTRPSASRHRHHHRNHHRTSSSSSHSPPKKKNRRRSDAELDHNLRGRPRRRSRERTRSPILESVSPPRNRRKRSQPPSRERRKKDGREDEKRSPEGRRGRSLPNQYYDDDLERYEWWRDDKWTERRYKERDGEEGLRREEWRGDGGDGRGGAGDGVAYKGRGVNKFKERMRR
ncbi:hypothetical protein K432DRAFT_424588 [Lepidopterella palustris CBS 459.81]|uniref:peptidylprolyl isomerase n=1 Tax=Lepidopterella palustris CBS 459.81 TaxID=1314670 RepID=A0A8E2ED94_9PEZI|nr:hypothetical protein K432DRAFT_424588 [Lepidopterella palustris CBS 459.81]